MEAGALPDGALKPLAGTVTSTSLDEVCSAQWSLSIACVRYCDGLNDSSVLEIQSAITSVRKPLRVATGDGSELQCE